ncbi:calcium-translocating P-type ATPase, PMCA-type [Acholeplasma vituli]|uniref:P-type Ca(2+) transporter n=1 Tax=Paracholeplasma vituli TaxID=69473 RepID=A0ABT2PVT6_9MOLU|nr:calcium-translocating P-type ATPase, PMCA-type [Paracholeplasma vituli]MCU0104521.1 calcium-translocating P-type ATPase, PMCA-type [Paracholeplasma vituli]
MWYSKSISSVVETLGVNPKTGLSTHEVEQRLTQHGLNQLTPKKKKSLIKLFFKQLNDVLIYVLIAAAILTIVASYWEGHTEFTDAIIIMLVVFINAFIGVFQEYKAEKAVEALQKMTSPKTLVRRDGEIVEVDSKTLVPGDIVLLDAGRFIPADLRLIESSNLQIEESALTGESVPSEKNAKDQLPEAQVPIGDQHNMAFLSTLVTYGRGEAVVVSTGMHTEMGKIAKILEEEDTEMTPLQKRLEELGKMLGIIALVICAIIFGLGILQGKELIEMFVTSISLAVAAIPEGLAAIVAIVLALGTTRMSKKNAIVKKLTAVETLGSVNIICSDKTGTLTQNKMTVTHVYTKNGLQPVESLVIHEEEQKLIEAFNLCNDATLTTGDPTEIALVQLAQLNNIEKSDLDRQFPRVDEKPFDSDRKRMSTLNQVDDGYEVYTKGALDSLLKVTTHIYDQGQIRPITNQDIVELQNAANDMSLQALRVLAAAFRPTKEALSAKTMENDLVIIGLIGMIDPPRLEVKDSINQAHQAHIDVLMITGDHRNTALAIAQTLNIAQTMDQTVSGSEIDQMSDEELEKNIRNYKVFARVSPEHKVKIVKTLKKLGYIVSMTGDGVNDAPSLKSADIGVAMGITGTDVSKNAADMILTDDNFTTIVHAIEEGRIIYNNIKKAVIFLLSCNFGEIVAIFISVLLGWPVPLLATQILWINLITDTLPAISLGLDESIEDVMKQKPRDKKESFFAERAGQRAIIGGILIGLATLFAFIIGLFEKGISFTEIGQVAHGEPAFIHASTMAFVVLAFSQLFYAFSLRSSHKTLLQVGVFKNKTLIGSLVIGVILQIAIINIPFFNDAFQVAPLNFADWDIVIILSLIPFIVNELIKWVASKRNKTV